MPAEVVFALNSAPFVESFATTSAFGIAAPLGSVINPVIAPRSPWANRTPNAAKVNTTALMKLFIPPTPPMLYLNIYIYIHHPHESTTQVCWILPHLP